MVGIWKVTPQVVTLRILLTSDRISRKSRFPQRNGGEEQPVPGGPTEGSAGVRCPGGPRVVGLGLAVLSSHRSHSMALSHFGKALSTQDVILELRPHLNSRPISFQDNFLTLTCP